jgi:hypothetical protein
LILSDPFCLTYFAFPILPASDLAGFVELRNGRSARRVR